jgi:hypothetical protein
MASRPEFPARALPVLAALYEQPTQWQDGSALAMQTGQSPERLRPILSRLAVSGLAQIAGPGKTEPGQPAGERYRLTAEGLASAAIALAAAAQPPDG